MSEGWVFREVTGTVQGLEMCCFLLRVKPGNCNVSARSCVLLAGKGQLTNSDPVQCLFRSKIENCVQVWLR